MFVESFKNNGSDYLRLVESSRCLNDKGVKTVRKKVIYNIGPVSKFDDGKPDFVQRVKSSFKNKCPIIPSLIPYCDAKPALETFSFKLVEEDPYCIGHPKLYSHILIERILEELGLITFFRGYKKYTNIEFDLLGFFRLLVYGRILNPASKIATVSQNHDYYDPIIDNPYEFNVYDTLDFIYRFRTSIFNKINKSMVDKYNRTGKIVYYDVTNFYFEINGPDDDTEDEDGSIVKGIRKNGVCKEERKLPIVQMGLFMDELGFPIACEIFPGNTLDHQTVEEALKNTIEKMDFERFIFIGDKGMCNYKNIYQIVNGDHSNGYIISKSILKSNKEEKAWLLDQDSYIIKSPDFKYKSRIIHKTIKNKDGNPVEITEKELVYWSKKFYDKQVHENKSFMDFIKKLKENPENFRISKTESKQLKKFLKKECLNKVTGEVLDSSKIVAMLDEDKLNAFTAYMGYYKIITSELKMDDLRIIEQYHNLTKIEEQFKIMKSSLDTRPIKVRTKEHIMAHLIICFIALLIIRMIQHKIVSSPKFIPSKEKNIWEVGLSADRIIAALNKWTIDKLPSELFRFNNIDEGDLKTILDAYDINIPCKLFRRSELKSIKTKIKI